MNIKFRSIEFFGVSGSGKSYLRGFIKKKLEEEGFQIFDTREIIVNFIDKLIPLNFSQKFDIFFFKILLKFNLKITLRNNRLNNIGKAFIKFFLKDFNFYKKKLNYLYNTQVSVSSKDIDIWLDELILASMIFNKIKKKNKDILFFPDEGFLQRIMILSFSVKKINLKYVKKYLNSKIFCDKVICIISSKKNIYKIHKRRSKKKGEWFANKTNIDKMISVHNMIKKSLPFKHTNFKNDYLENSKFYLDKKIFFK